MVKITTRALKIGVQSRFYPISTVRFCTFFPKKFGQAYYVYALMILFEATPIIKQKLLITSAQNQHIVHVCACFPIQHTHVALAAYDFFPLTKLVTNVVGPSPVAYQTSVVTSCIALYYPKKARCLAACFYVLF